MDSTPTVYILHGEDEYAIAQAISEMESRLGDPSFASLNITRLEASAFQPDQILSLAGTIPFLAKRRLVIVTSGLAKLKEPETRKKFLAQCLQLPPTSALILVEHYTLTSYREQREHKVHWLEKWAQEHKEQVWIKQHALPRGAEWNKRIQEMARKAGGQSSPGVAARLASLVDGDLRLADQELNKLLAYVNYARTVDVDDVEALTADVGQGDIFKMVDALGGKDGRTALGMLRRLLEYQEVFSIFGMVVRQFRMLILARQVLDDGGDSQGVSRALEVVLKSRAKPDSLIAQARRFSYAELVRIYDRLLAVDEAVKTSQMPGELALETLVASLVSVTALPGQVSQ